MFRLTIKIERLPVVTRRRPEDHETTPELVVQTKATTVLGAMRQAIRVLTNEFNALSDQQVIGMSEPDEDEEED